MCVYVSFLLNYHILVCPFGVGLIRGSFFLSAGVNYESCKAESQYISNLECYEKIEPLLNSTSPYNREREKKKMLKKCLSHKILHKQFSFLFIRFFLSFIPVANKENGKKNLSNSHKLFDLSCFIFCLFYIIFSTVFFQKRKMLKKKINLSQKILSFFIF